MPLLRRVFGPIPFARLGYVHALGAAADAFFTVSLAGSLFFNVSTGAARPRVIAYLAVTLAPFVFLAPFVGPLIDRFGRARRIVAASTCLGRGILCLFIAGDLRDVLLYPEAFGILVLDKAYSVTKSALVPSLVGDDADLVSANSRLARISTLAGLVGGGIAVGILNIGSATAVLRIASLIYFGAAVAALRIPPDPPTRLPAAALEREELQSPKIRFAAGAMAVLRAAIGFLVFAVAFALKRANEPTWFFATIAALSVGGGLAGTIFSPLLRRHTVRDESLLTAALATAAVVSIGSAVVHLPRLSVGAGVFAVAAAASTGRQGFDSILQRDAPDAARGRSFARFETLFQLTWVLGALCGVALRPDTRRTVALLGVAFGVTLVVYLVGIASGSRPRRSTAGA